MLVICLGQVPYKNKHICCMCYPWHIIPHPRCHTIITTSDMFIFNVLSVLILLNVVTNVFFIDYPMTMSMQSCQNLIFVTLFIFCT